MRRDTFLAGIRRQLEQARLPQSAESPPPLPTLSQTPPRNALIAQFTREAQAVNADVYLTDSAESARRHVLALFEQVEVTHFLSWDASALPLPELNLALAEHGYQRVEGALPREADSRAARQNEMARAQIGVTGAQAGLADTGTLVLEAGAGRGRLASLLPPVHVALLSAETLFPTLHHYIRTVPDANRDSSNVTMVTGPSRTGDIGGVLTLGVHGPKVLHIVLLTA